MAKLRNILKKITFTTTALALTATVPAVLISNKEGNVYKTSQYFNSSSSSGADGSTSSGTNDYEQYSNIQSANTTVNVVDLTKTDIAQHTEYDLENTGYATFTSSKTTKNGATASGTTTVDQITKFQTMDAFSTGNTKTSNVSTYAGQVAWNIKSSDLAKLVDKLNGVNNGGSGSGGSSTTTSTTVELKAMLFSVGGYGFHKSLFVLGRATTNSTGGGGSPFATSSGQTAQDYLFQINWEDQTIGSTTHKAGDYRLVAKLPSGTNFNQIVLEATSTHTMQVLAVPDISVSSSSSREQRNSSQTVTYVNVDNKNFENPSSGITGTKTISLDTSKNFENSKTYKPKYASRIGSNIFLIYQDSSKTLGDKSIVLAKSQSIASTGNNAAITFDKIENIDLTSMNEPSASANANQPTTTNFLINTLYNNNTNNPIFDFVITSDKNKYIHSTLNFNEFTIERKTLEGYTYKNPIIKLVGRYQANGSVPIGYYGLTSDNKVILLKTDFSLEENSLLFDFAQSTISFGNIYSIYTKISDASWYALMTNGKFAKFSNDTLLGQWDELSKQESYELPIRFNIKSQNEVSSSILFKEVAENDGNSYSSTFLQYLQGSNTYNDFLNVDLNSLDPRLNGALPVIKVEVLDTNTNTGGGSGSGKDATPSWTEEQKQSKQYPVTLVFKQVLRKISSSGVVSPAEGEGSKTIELGRYTYTFNNAVSTIKVNNDKNAEDFSMPSYVLNMYPSDIVAKLQKSVSNSENETIEDKNFLNFFVKIENVSGATYSFVGNDVNGTLSITISAPLLWDSQGPQENFVQTYEFGSDGDPFFNYNPFGKDANGQFNDRVTPIDENYVKLAETDQTAKTKLDNLKAIYSSVLPSSLSKQDYLKNFLDLGVSFNNPQYQANGLITMPENDNIVVVPNDIEGKAFVQITFPNIGPKNNYKVSFETPAIFATNPSASQPVYFAWKTNDQVQLPSQTSTGVSTAKASTYAAMINGSSGTSLLDILKIFADYSSYYTNLILSGGIKVVAKYNDGYGILNIDLVLQNGTQIPGINGTSISNTFNGFNTTSGSTSDGTIEVEKQTFTFGTYNGDKNKAASSITEADLSSVLPANWETLKVKNNAVLTLTPSNSTGILQVSVTLSNYLTENTVLNSKTFTTTIPGFKVSNQSTNLITWKTNDNFGKDKFPSAVKSEILSDVGGNVTAIDYNYNVLTRVATISSELNQELKSKPELVGPVSLIENNVDGTLSVNTSIKIDGVTQPFSTVITGLKGTAYSYSLQFKVSAEGEGNASLTNLRKLLPSQITADNENLLSLFSIEASDNLTKEISLASDDFSGTLTIGLKITDSQNGTVLMQETRTYGGFAKQNYTQEGTNWGIVVIGLVVPIIVLSIPLVLINVLQTRRDMKKIQKRLATRLNEEFDKKKRKEKIESLSKIK